MLDIISHKNNRMGSYYFNQLIKKISLIILDKLWKEHLILLDKIKIGIELRIYEQKNPFNEYRFETFKLFRKLFLLFNKNFILNIINFY